MRILQVHPTFTSVKGGVERHIEGLSKYLARRKHEVEILTTERGPDLTCEDGGVIVRRSHKFASLFSVENYDIVHVHGYRVPWANLFGFFHRLRNDRVVMTTHGIYPFRSLTDALLKKTYDHTIGGVNIRLFDALIALTPETRDALISFGAQRDKIRIIPNSIDVERFSNLPSSNVFLDQFGIPSDKKIVLYVGRVDWNKGLDMALNGFSLVAEELPEAVMVVIGRDYGYLSRLKDLSCRLGLGDKVFLVGEVSEAMLYSAYDVADVFLLSSVYEGLPTVVLEAMACGVPVIAFRTGGTAYAIEHGETGLLVDYNDCKDMAEQLLMVLSDKSFKERLVRNAKALVEQRYSWAKNAECIEALYEHVFNRKGLL